MIEDLVSTQLYPFDVLTDPVLQGIIQERAAQGSSWFTREFPNKELEPLIDNCDGCGGTDFIKFRSSRLHRFRATIYTDTEFLDGFDIYSKQCKGCNKKYPFDGRSWGLVNFKDSSIFPGTV